MGAGIIRVSKVKADAIGGLQRHIEREGESHSNPDIDVERSAENRSWLKNGNYREFVSRRIAEGRESTKAVRKDAVVMVDGIVTLPHEDYVRLGDAGTAAYLRDAARFVQGYFGRENMVFYTLHLDETTPHAHFGAVPIRDGSLSWKKFFPSKAALSHFQDAFWRDVSSKYGLERGQVRREGEPVRRHKSVAAMKKEAERELAQAEKDRDKAVEDYLAIDNARAAAQSDFTLLQEEVRRLDEEARKAKEEAVRARALVQAESERLERLRCACGEREAEIAATKAATGEVSREVRESARDVVDTGRRILAGRSRVGLIRSILAEIREQISSALRKAPQGPLVGLVGRTVARSAAQKRQASAYLRQARTCQLAMAAPSAPARARFTAPAPRRAVPDQCRETFAEKQDRVGSGWKPAAIRMPSPRTPGRGKTR